MSNLPGEGRPSIPELPTPEQLEEFLNLSRELIVRAPKLITIDEGSLAEYKVNPNKSVDVGINRAQGLFEDDAIDVVITNISIQDGIRLVEDEKFAYAASTGATHYEQEAFAFKDGVRLKDLDRQEMDELIRIAGYGEALRLAMLSDEELAEEDSELAEWIRQHRTIEEKLYEQDPYRKTLTRDRIETALKELRQLAQKTERPFPFAKSDVGAFLGRMFADEVEYQLEHGPDDEELSDEPDQE